MTVNNNSRTWQLQAAKSHFSAVVNKALSGKPQLVTKNGKPAVYIIAVRDYEKLKKQKNLKQMLLSSPHKEVDLLLERQDDQGRKIAL